MKIDLTCPVELWRYQLPTQAEEACTLLLYNLSEKDVTSIQVTLAGYDAQGEVLSRQVERLQGLEGTRKTAFEVSIAMEGGEQAAGMELVIEKVWFDDGIVWRRGNAHLSEYVPNTLPNNRRLEMLRYAAGADAVGYPQDQGAVWLCICGRANAASETQCRRCQREKLKVFEEYNQTAIEELVAAREKELEQIAHKARMQASQQQLEREARLKRKKLRRRRVLIIASAILLVSGSAYGIYFHGIPYYKYFRANQQLQSGLYQEAKAAFEQMPGYLNANELVTKSDYLRAKHDLDTGTIESLQSAEVLFYSLGSYGDSVELAKAARYQQAEKNLKDGEYDKAIAIYSAILDYSNARERQQDAQYQKAESMMKAGQYEEARKIFLLLNGREDAQKKANECLYEPGIKALDMKDYMEAIDYLSQLAQIQYQDSVQKLKEARYGLGEQLKGEQQYAEAGKQYLLAEDYRDAQTKAWECIYEPAKREMEAGNLSKAAEMFMSIQGYQDSKELAQKCTYLIAEKALGDKEYDKARELFLSIVGYDGAQEMANEAIYLPAQDLVKENKYEQALTEFAKIPDYKDVASQVQSVRYKQASAYMASGDYDNAILMYQELGDYSDSSTRIQDALYAKAGQLLAAEDYQGAIDQYSGLSGYMDSADKVKEAKYLLAIGLKEKGEYQQAIALFESLGKYKEAKAQLDACNYAQGKLYLEAGQLDKAAEIFKGLGSYEDAQSLFKQSNYQVAVNARDAGDLNLAGRLFLAVGDYQDAQAQSEASFDGYYAQVLSDADAAMRAKNYKAVVDILAPVDLSDLPKKYKELGDMYSQANYEYANDLYADGRPYEALPYYRNIPDYKDVSTRRLTRSCYQVLGKWVSKTGVSMEFREDGTCVIDGEELFFNVVGSYTMNTGVTRDRLTLTHKVTNVSEDGLTLRDLRNGRNVIIKMTKAE